MGIRFNCPNGHKLNVKEFLAGKRGVCPQCGAKFIIPMPSERAATEVPQPVGVGLSQSVRSPAPSHKSTSATASPSVIIPVSDLELAPPEAELPPEIHGTQIPVGDALPASIVTVQSPIAVPPMAAVPSQRERTRRNQILISLLLLGLVVVLAGVLIWVLQREANQAPQETKATVVREEINHVFAMESHGLLAVAHLRVGALNQ